MGPATKGALKFCNIIDPGFLKPIVLQTDVDVEKGHIEDYYPPSLSFHVTLAYIYIYQNGKLKRLGTRKSETRLGECE